MGKKIKTEIHTIELPLPFRAGSVNAYLVGLSVGFILVDTGMPRNRGALEWALTEADCGSKDLKLIVLTHGDFDHIGNAAYLREAYSTKIAMHSGDAGAAKRGDMFAGRTTPPNPIVHALAPRIARFGKGRRFKPDVLLEDGKSLRKWGLEATVLSLPGHSAGSIGLLTDDGDLIAGDLFENVKGPKLNSIMDDGEQAQASVERLRSLGVGTVYPGHGAPFELEELSEAYSAESDKQ